MTVDPDKTGQLLSRWHSGDREALHELLRRNLDWMEQRIRQRLGKGLRRAGETQDFVQDAMIQALEYGPRFKVADQDQFRRLLARIIENNLRQKHRYLHQDKRDIDRERPVECDTLLSLDPPQQEVTRPTQQADRNEEIAWVRLALEFLCSQDREVIWMHEYEHKTFAEIGRRLDMTEDSIRMRFNRALPRLARRVSELQSGQVDAALTQAGSAG